MSPFATEVLIFILISSTITAGAAYAIYWTLNDSPVSRWLHDADAVAPSFVSITAFIFGLTVSTLAGYSFNRHESAVSNLIIESSALDTLTNVSLVLPSRDKDQISSGIENYINAVIEKEWPAMRSKDFKKREIALPEFMALSKIINKLAYESNLRSSIEGQLESSLTIIRESRKTRHSLAFDNTNIRKWISIPISSLLLLLSVGIIHLGSLKAMKVSLSIASLCIVTAMTLLYISVTPYGAWNPVEPLQLQESLRILGALRSP